MMMNFFDRLRFAAAPAGGARAVLAIAAILLMQPAAFAQRTTKPKPAAAKTDKAAAKKEAAKPTLVATYGDWGVYSAASGKSKTCYALGQPKDRQPDNLKRDPAYVFISNRPGEGVHDEISIILGFDVKAGADPEAAIGDRSFAMVAKGGNLWIKNAAEEGQMVEAMKKGAKMTVKALSTRGNLTTDTYSLTGLTQSVERMAKDCR
jgi:hypothetical protein